MPFRLSRNSRLVQFPSADGLALEGRLTPGDPGRAVVLCHPHPLYGGSMLTPVIMQVEQAFQEAGYTTLAFNFRGVGGSGGAYGEGRAEGNDVKGALDFLADTLGAKPPDQAVAGDFGFLHAASTRIALIGGSLDQFGDAATLKALADALPGRAWVRLIATDHFFSGALEALAEACRDAIAWARGTSEA